MLLRLFAVLLAVLFTCPTVRAQESVRDLTGAQNSKFLTPNQLDRWLFEGEKGETIIAHIASKDFDPIVGLARTGTKDDKPLLEVDDPGSESRFAVRLPDNGKFEIRVNAFKFQGGGNYTLRVQGEFLGGSSGSSWWEFLGTPPLLFGTVVADGRCDFYLRNARATVGHDNFLKYLFSLARELRYSMTTIFRCHICNSVWPTTNPSPIFCPRMSKD